MFIRLLPLLLVVAATAHGLLDTSDCGVFKGCFTNPPQCNGQTGECTSAMTYRRLSTGYVAIELQRTMQGNGTQYVAVGFSKDGARMGDDLVIACISDEHLGGGVYLTRNRQHSSSAHLSNEVTSANLRASRVSSANGTLYCSTEVMIAGDAARGGFPLDHPYTLLLAYGSAEQGVGGQPTVNRHGLGAALPIASTEEINIAASVAEALISREAPYMHRLRQAHGCLMIIGWWVMSVIAIVTARYYKNTWPTITLGGKAVWFQMHRMFNVMLLLCITSAAICVFWANGWKVDSLHPILGLVTVALAWTQPLNALARCGPTAEKRPIFNWIHRIIGMSAWILGSVTIYLATFFDSQGLSVVIHGWTPRFVMFIYWSIVAFCILTLEALKFLPAGDRTDTVSMTPINRARGGDQHKVAQDNYVVLRTLIHMLLCTVAIVVAVVLCVFIGKYSPRYD